MVEQTLTYRCDVPECSTLPVVNSEPLFSFNGPVPRPCAPTGWRHIEHYGLLCAAHEQKFGAMVGQFFVEPGHE